MPRNRQLVPREQRVNEFVTAGTELFLSLGYGKTRMSDIAKAVGVANAALYWYFPSKDELLAEIWNRALDAEIERLRASTDKDPFDRLLDGLAHLRPYRQLHMTLHDRMPESEVVVEAHDRLLTWVRDLVSEGLSFHGHPESDREAVTELFVVLFEGLNVPGIRASPASEIMQVLRALLFPASEPTSTPQ